MMKKDYPIGGDDDELSRNDSSERLRSLIPRRDFPPEDDLITHLRKANRKEREILLPREQPADVGTSFSLGRLKEQVEEITGINKDIEDAVKREVLGLGERGFLSGLWYWLQNSSRQSKQPAEEIIRGQIRKVHAVTEDMSDYDEELTQRLEVLEERYHAVFEDLLSTHEEAQTIRQGFDGKRRELSSLQEAAERTSDPRERLEYAREGRKIRKDIRLDLHQVKLNDKAFLILQHEIPVLDGLGSVCEAYSYTLKETIQASAMMGSHLNSVMSLYLDMLRSQRANLQLEPQLKVLFTYTHNMARALETGGQEIVNQGYEHLFQESYDADSQRLDRVLERVEESTFAQFQELEKRLGVYGPSGGSLQ